MSQLPQLYQKKILPVSFITPLADVHVYEKDEAKFELEISREPKSFRWMKGSQELSNDDKFELLVEERRHTLIVKSARYEDEGARCNSWPSPRTPAPVEASVVTVFLITTIPKGDGQKLPRPSVQSGADRLLPRPSSPNEAERDVGETPPLDLVTEKNYTFFLCVYAQSEPPVEFTKPLEDQTVEEEATATLECEVSRENAEVRWFRDGQEIRKTKKYEMIIDGRKRALLIHDCTMDDSRTYTCDTKDFKTSSFTLVLIFPELAAEFISRPQSQEVVEGEKAEFTCSVSKETYDVKWLRDNKELEAGDKYQMVSDGKRRTLVIKDCELKDEGAYVVMIGATRASADLTVHGKPRPQTFRLGEVMENRKAGWKCFPASRKIAQSHTLTVKDCTLADEGEYTAVATENKSTAELIISELAGKSSDCTHRPEKLHHLCHGGEKIVVHAGGTIRIIAYVSGKPAPQITWFRDNAEVPKEAKVETTGISNSLVIKNCRRQHQGIYTLSAKNEAGERKKAVIVEVLGVPDAPKQPTVKEVYHDSALVSWEPPADGGKPITESKEAEGF
uniref:Ig-like domain-containing protein n=1 Tax=Monopterus albus TaxID=43700 RepID=A0A3Q3JQP7_MONAL